MPACKDARYCIYIAPPLLHKTARTLMKLQATSNSIATNNCFTPFLGASSIIYHFAPFGVTFPHLLS
jgi:hypothetical protein